MKNRLTDGLKGTSLCDIDAHIFEWDIHLSPAGRRILGDEEDDPSTLTYF